MKLQQLLGEAPLKAILFDLDGTLVDSVPDLAAAMDAALIHCGYPGAGEERVRTWVGNGAAKLVERALDWAESTSQRSGPPVQHGVLLDAFYLAYAEDSSSRSQLFPGVIAALEYWQQAGIKLACVTNKPERFTHPILAEFGLQSLLPVVVGGDTLAQRKPDPAPLLHACERLGVAAGNTVMVGDSSNDIDAAHAAGMPAACVSYGYNHGAPIAEAGADLLVDDFGSLR